MSNVIPMSDSEDGPVHLATWGFHDGQSMRWRALCGEPVHLIPFGGAPVTCPECGRITEQGPGF